MDINAICNMHGTNITNSMNDSYMCIKAELYCKISTKYIVGNRYTVWGMNINHKCYMYGTNTNTICKIVICVLKLDCIVKFQQNI